MTSIVLGAPLPEEPDVDAELAAALEVFLARNDVPAYLRVPAERWLARPKENP